MSDHDELKPRPPDASLSQPGDKEHAQYPADKMIRDPRSAQIFAGQGGRIPPQAPEVERAILGAMMLEADAIAPAIELVGSKAGDALLHAFSQPPS